MQNLSRKRRETIFKFAQLLVTSVLTRLGIREFAKFIQRCWLQKHCSVMRHAHYNRAMYFQQLREPLGIETKDPKHIYAS